MNLDDLKDQLRDQWNSLVAKVQENPTYNTLRERFDTLPGRTQRLILGGAAVLMTLFLLSIPYSYLSSSSAYVAEFEEYRELIRDLLRTSRAGSGQMPLPPTSSAGSLVDRYTRALNSHNLLPEQIGTVEPVAVQEKKLVPPGIETHGLNIQLRKLNLNELISIGSSLQALNETVKMLDMQISANREDNHYFDVLFKFVAFTMPDMEEAEEPAQGQRRPRPGAKGRPGQ